MGCGAKKGEKVPDNDFVICPQHVNIDAVRPYCCSGAFATKISVH